MAVALTASDPPAAVRSPASEADVIEIVGTRSGEALKIDRRTYQVRDNPHSAQKDTLQLLRGLPAITISPDDTINLLGAGNVTILIDGHQTRTDLRTLHGSDIDRIEVITNPSAQYSAEGTGGIINLVLRKKRSDGLSGNATLELSSAGRATPTGTIKIKHGKWSYEISGEVGVGTWGRSNYHKLRTTRRVPGGASTINSEDGGGPIRDNHGFGRFKATYDLDPRTSVAGEVLIGGGGGTYVNHATFIGLTPDFPSFTQVQHDDEAATFGVLNLTFDHKGKQDGETLKASFSVFGNPSVRRTTEIQTSDEGSLLSERRYPRTFGESKIDWTHPLAGKRILSLGAQWNFQTLDQHYRFAATSPAGLVTATTDNFRAVQNNVAAYATFQQPIGSWTLMPGLRIERNARRVVTPGLPDVRIDRTDLVPSLHVDHPIEQTLVLTLSYSRRLDRPDDDALRPYPVQQDVLTILQGNPRLRDQHTDAFEINLHYHRKKIDAGLIVYDRATRDLFANSYSVDALGRNVSTWINAGRKRDRGAQFDVNLPLLPRTKLSSSVNLFSSRVPIDASTAVAASEERFRYTAQSTLEWDGPDRRGKPGDVAQFVWHYESPATLFQFRNFAWNQFTLSYTHNLDRQWSVTATGDTGALHNGHRLVAPLVDEIYRVNRSPEFKVKLMKTFGKN